MISQLHRLANRCVLAAVLFGFAIASAWADDIDYEDLPQAVQDALSSLAPGLTIDEIESEDDGDEFEIEGWVEAGGRVEILIAADGQLISMESDTDEDGIGDGAEVAAGTDPNDPDTDDDMFPDGFEIDQGTDPSDAGSRPEIVTIRTEGAGAGALLVVEVQTFTTGLFQLEHCSGDLPWMPMGEPECGDGSTIEFELPVADTTAGGLFRVTITADPDSGHGGGDNGGGSTGSDCGMPDDFTGLEIVMSREDESRTLHFTTAGSGDLVEREDGEVEVDAFDYTVSFIGECVALVVITFPSDDEGDEYEEFELTFTSQGVGTYRSQDFEDGKGEDPESGGFTVGGS